MEKVEWKVEGMDCTNCALTINKYLDKQGLKNVKVNFIGGDVSFEMNDGIARETLAKGIEDLGYQVVKDQQTPAAEKKFTFFQQSSATFSFLSSLYTHLNAAYASMAYSFFNEPVDTVSHLCSGIFCCRAGRGAWRPPAAARRGQPRASALGVTTASACKCRTISAGWRRASREVTSTRRFGAANNHADSSASRALRWCRSCSMLSNTSRPTLPNRAPACATASRAGAKRLQHAVGQFIDREGVSQRQPQHRLTTARLGRVGLTGLGVCGSGECQRQP